MNFFFIRQDELTSDTGAAVKCDERFERLRRSMNVCEGTVFRVAVENMGRGSGRVQSLDSSEIKISFILDDTSEGCLRIEIMLAVPRPKVFAKLIPRLASMGISSLTLVNAAGVKKEYFSTHWLEAGRIRELLVAGAEQSGVFRLPDVMIEQRLRPFIEDTLGASKQDELRLLCSPSQHHHVIRCGRYNVVRLAVGPETGWTSFEKDMFIRAGFTMFSMGPEHLACDVAAIAAVANVKFLAAQLT